MTQVMIGFLIYAIREMINILLPESKTYIFYKLFLYIAKNKTEILMGGVF